MWRFGRWAEVIVDDQLPMLDDELAYTPILGDGNEVWAALIEKAFAK